jgi:hypothetical protein
MQLPTQLPTRLPTRLNTIEDYYLATGGGGRLQPETRQAIQRVQADGGVVEDPQFLNQLIAACKEENILSDLSFLTVAGLGEKFRLSGTDRFVSVAYDMSGRAADFSQTSESLQPQRVGQDWDMATGKLLVGNAAARSSLRNALGATALFISRFPGGSTDAAGFNLSTGGGSDTTTGWRVGLRSGNSRVGQLATLDADATVSLGSATAFRSIYSVAGMRIGGGSSILYKEKAQQATASVTNSNFSDTDSVIAYLGGFRALALLSWNDRIRGLIMFRSNIPLASYNKLVDVITNYYADIPAP